MRPIVPPVRQRGLSLLEALLSVLIFSVGILALVALQGISVKATTESKFRADAGFLASQLIARMWTDVTELEKGKYAHNAGGADCAFGGGPSAYGPVTDWTANVAAALPGNDPTMTQIVTAPGNLVTINICWRPPGHPAGEPPRRYSTVTQIVL